MEEKREQKTIKGFGRIFKPRYKRKSTDGSRTAYKNPIWWIAYYHNGEELRATLLKRRRQSSS